DAFASVFSLAATFMVTRKVLENWVYWIIVNLVNIYLFSSRELNLTGVVYAIYAIIAVFGLINWIRLYKAQT
ncbi:MAG: nicotinamide mononucleotide transporter, partial [Flavobacteriales bacterium]